MRLLAQLPTPTMATRIFRSRVTGACPLVVTCWSIWELLFLAYPCCPGSDRPRPVAPGYPCCCPDACRTVWMIRWMVVMVASTAISPRAASRASADSG